MIPRVQDLVHESWRDKLGWHKLSETERDQLGHFALHQFKLGKYTHGDIESVKYGGRLVTLDDGSRWEVDSLDEYTAESWGPYTSVVVIDDKMYNLGDAEAIAVEEEFD